MRTFLERFFADTELLELIVDTIETEECVPCDQLSLFYTIMSGGYSLENLKVYLGLAKDVTDELKVREGMSALVLGIIRKAEQQIQRKQLVRLSEPVLEILNDRQPVEVVTSKRRYKCAKVVWSIPLATCKNIKVSLLSPSKRMLFHVQ